MHYLFYNEITGEEQEIYAVSYEEAVSILNKTVSDPPMWRLQQPEEEREDYQQDY